MKKLMLLGAMVSMFVVAFAGSALAAVDTDAISTVTSVTGDVQDTALAAIPVLLGAVLAVGLTLWGIRFVLRKFGVRTSG